MILSGQYLELIFSSFQQVCSFHFIFFIFILFSESFIILNKKGVQAVKLGSLKKKKKPLHGIELATFEFLIVQNEGGIK